MRGSRRRIAFAGAAAVRAALHQAAWVERWLGVVVLTVVALVLGGCGLAPAGLSASAPVAQVLGITLDQTVTTLRGEPIVGAAVLRAAATVRGEVISAYGEPLGPGFWDRGRDGTTPRQALREKAVGAAVLEMARRMWAREAGLITDVTEQAFHHELATENARRARAAAAGGPLPGVPSYDEYTYAQVRGAELDSALSKLYASKLDLSERRLREQYKVMAGPDAPPFDQARDNVRQALIIQGYQKALHAFSLGLARWGAKGS